MFEDIFKYLVEPTVDFCVGISFLYLFYQLAKSDEEHKKLRTGIESLSDIRLVFEETEVKRDKLFSINFESEITAEL